MARAVLSRRAMRITLLALAIVSLAPSAIARADDVSPGRAFVLRVGAGGDVLVGPDRVAPVVVLAGLLPFAEWGGVEIGARLGVDPESGVGRAWVSLEAGLRAELPLDAWRPYASLRIAHTHDAPHASWGDHFGETLAGDPTYGMVHLTAMGGALGVAWLVPGTDEHLVLSIEMSALGRVHGHQQHAHHGAQHRAPDAWIGGTVQAGWQFL